MSTTETEQLQAFLFRVLAVNENRGVGVSMEDPTPGVIASFGSVAREQARFMGHVYELLYCLENSVRELVESTLRGAFGDENWWVGGVQPGIRKIAEKRRLDDAKARWHGPRGDTLLSYVDFPQYAEIIEEQWEHFEPLLGDLEWVSYYFAEMNRTRRALAHTGSLTPADVERMELRVREWLRVVG